MASFVPLISEILPMIMPATTHVVRAEEDVGSELPRAEGPVSIRSAIVDKCDEMSSTVVTIRPRSDTPIQHNSEQDAIIYAVAGRGTLTVNEGFEAELRKHEIGAGDFAFVPAWTEHQISNAQDMDFVCVVIQGGPRPAGTTLSDWGGDVDTSGS